MSKVSPRDFVAGAGTAASRARPRDVDVVVDGAVRSGECAANQVAGQL